MKTVKIYAILGTMLVALLFTSCTKDNETELAPAPNPTHLNADEKAGLLLMVEIEKLHHDVYQGMSENNQCELFGDLCNCDKNFKDLLSEKVDNYKLENPLNDRGAGIYADTELQAKYNEYLEISDGMLQDFLVFARQLEENALAELEIQITQLEGNSDIAEVYANIKAESTCQLETIMYKIEHLDPVEHPGNPPDDI